jgi:hypothetical protein
MEVMQAQSKRFGGLAAATEEAVGFASLVAGSGKTEVYANCSHSQHLDAK